MTPDPLRAATDNVVAIETRFTEAPPVDLLPYRYDECGHRHTILDQGQHRVDCRDCGKEGLDPFGVLVTLAHAWRDRQREADKLRELRAEYQGNQRDQWERARDRHLNANPSHRSAFRPRRAIEDHGGWHNWVNGEQPCRTCDRLEMRYDRRWDPTQAPEPPSGRLTS